MLDTRLPLSLVQHIFEFDPTYREVYSKIVQERFDYVDSGRYRVNKITGHHRLFHDDGSLSWEFTIRDGRCEDIERWYYRDRLVMEKQYKDGVLDGPYREFYETTGRKKVEKWFKKGKEEGVVAYWFADGTLFQTSFYRGGRKHGPFLQFGVHGELRSMREYREGRLWKEHM
jgi:antitoxin component YwqK of YwqJK toxin-antitoxin module